MNLSVFNKKTLFLISFYIVSAAVSLAQQSLKVNITKTGAKINPKMYGIFFEDINLGADGGLYAELVKNRSFEFNEPLMGWKIQNEKDSVSSVLVNNRIDKKGNNPHFLQINKMPNGSFGISNEGFRGLGIQKNEQYDFSIWARQNKESKIQLRIELRNSKNEIIGTGSLKPTNTEWQKYAISFMSNGTEAKSRLYVWFEGEGKIDIDMVSLFPKNTWKQRPEGLRADLVQLLADMKPGFLRFPGGCIVEGRELATRYQWKKTIGKIEEREMIVNRWNTEFAHRPTPDYFQTFGLGFFEYFQLSEDLGAEPLPIINCGMACQFNSKEVVPIDQIDPFVQDALDLIEFANGSVETTWGKLRAALGHPSSFNLRLLGVGNEQWGPQYIERYKIFTKAIKEKYPEIQIISSVGPNPDGELFEFLDKNLRALKADIVDEHYYRSPEWFFANASRYDKYDRNGPKIFAGEYAAQSVAAVSPDNKNNWECALSEAAFMTGLERNADVVHIASYAPLFAHEEGWQWTPDMIWFNNLQAYGTPNYYVQQLYSLNKGTHVVSATINNEVVAGQNGMYSTASIDKNTNEIIVKLVNASDKEVVQNIELEGVNKLAKLGTITSLKSEKLDQVNSFNEPSAVFPKVENLKVTSKKMNIKLSAYSFSIIRVKML